MARRWKRWFGAAAGLGARRPLIAGAALLAAVIVAAQWLLSVLKAWQGGAEPLVSQLIPLAILPISWFLIARGFALSAKRAVMAWLPQLAVAGAGTVLLLGLNTWVGETYGNSTNSMAPTVLGPHLTAPCPSCGSPAYGSVTPFVEPEGTLMICSRELQPCRVVDPPPQVGPSDRILVNKLLAPRRWDLMVFRYPEDPEIIYVKRVVGLPGEQVMIRDGAVWIDGQRQQPPAEIAEVAYLDELPGHRDRLHGAEGNPAQLGDDEYFVLGDFSAASSDSRVWIEGAPGHPPYAVPRSHLVGVVTHIYWPISRWRAFK